MYRDKLTNLNLRDIQPLLSPKALKAELPVNESLRLQIIESRAVISQVIRRRDPRLAIVVGPCSIHDPNAALAYGEQLAKLADEVKQSMVLVMRVYFEKPRTTVGWKGLINDPHLDDSFDVPEGLRIARKLLLALLEMGLPLATEALDPITPQYLADLFSWAAIGARTTESQTHREMASGLSMPVGFKNGTDGGLQTAVDAAVAARTPHHFLGINQNGQVALVTTAGNPDGHIILRGGLQTNYDAGSVAACEALLHKAGLTETSIMVDCSHANSGKQFKQQPKVAMDVVHQVVAGNRTISGLMLESNLFEGNQSRNPGTPLKYGVSITDECIDFDTTSQLLRNISRLLLAK